MSGELVQSVCACDTFQVFDISHTTEDDENIEQEEPASTDPDAHEKLAPVGWINLWGDEELRKLVVEPGKKNTMPDHGSKCMLSMVGCLKDGTTFDDFEHFKIQVGHAEVVLGIDLVLFSMTVGEKALVEVSPKLGYGSLGRYPDIPPNEALIYLIQLEAAEPEQDLSTYTISELKAIGVRKCECGEWWHSRNEFTIALGLYECALYYLGYEDRALGNSSSEHDEILEYRLQVIDNIAALAKYDVALEAVEHVLACRSCNVKALYRKGKLLEALGRHSEALEVLSLAMEIEPENIDLRNEANAILKVMTCESPDAKKLQEEMFGGDTEDAAETKTENSEMVNNVAVNNEAVNSIAVDNEAVKNGNIDEDTVVNTDSSPTTLKTKTTGKANKSALNLKRTKKPTKSKSRFAFVGVFTVVAAVAGFVAYRSRNNTSF